ncbi:DUF1907-domain-containing protein [Aspergillus karnatakaensis]|uniref:PTD012 family protein n=1 Tax=Aspergillus karnatakaensis TaxID=1810916 RepID=UPI003CCCDB40
MNTTKFPLAPPSLKDLAEKLQTPLVANYKHATVSVVQCPDLRARPFNLATEGLSGDEKIADIGGQGNLFPRPRLDTIYSMEKIAEEMEMTGKKGSLIGAGAGPFQTMGSNCELAPNLAWEGEFRNLDNWTCVAQIDHETGSACINRCTSTECALMANLYGCIGNPGPVLKITARKRRGVDKSFTECIRKALIAGFGDSRTISLGGAFLIKSGKTRYHIMPNFPPVENLPFRDFKQVNDWLRYHDFSGPIVCLSVLHSADPGQKMGLRMEHTHGFSPIGADAGGHYHYEVDGGDEDIEYEGYFNTAKVIYRIARPEVMLDGDLHD